MISSLGDATSLSGGVLMLTPLKGADGRVYAVAQGSVSLGGGYVAIAVGAKVSKNHQTAGRLPGGVLVERGIPSKIVNADGEPGAGSPSICRILRRLKEFLMRFSASRLGTTAEAMSPGLIRVLIPPPFRNDPVSFVSALESLDIAPDQAARIVVNERTGTIIISKNVSYFAGRSRGAFGLHIVIKTEARVSQPNSFGRGQTAVVPDSSIEVRQQENRQLVELPGGAGVLLTEIVQALNALGVTPHDLIAVFEALREAGALQADLVIM